jgi:TM2 domain-containing membrane protein YozV
MKNKNVAILLAFFLGWSGIHKFYLGEKVAGVLYFVFFWSFIPSIFAFLDFIGLLLMSEERFNALYNGQYYLKPQEQNYRLNSSSNTSHNISNLKQLKELYDEGIITAEEYEQKRRKFLDLL